MAPSEARLVAGPVYRPGEGFRDGWVLQRGDRVVDAGDGAPPEAPDARGVVLPAPVNAHTHVGDRVGRGTALVGLSLAQVVAPPDGLKHRLLRETAEEKLLEGMRKAVQELAEHGCRRFVDFREQGVPGVGLLRRACEGTPVEPVVLGRPAAGWPDEEIAQVLDVADGLGLSGMGDVADDAPERAARAARERGKRFALHFSEAEREDVARVLALAPDFLVHATAAPREDLSAIAEADVPVVLCPRSNGIFGLVPDVPTMLEVGVPLALGSDNAMFHSLDVLLDVRFLRQTFPEVARATLLDVALAGGRRVLDGAAPASWLQKGDEADFIVLEPHGDDPLDAVFGAQPPRVTASAWRERTSAKD